MRTAIFLERDGVLNRVKPTARGWAPPLTAQEFEPNLAALAPLEKLRAAGFLLLVTTNQPGVSHGTIHRRELDRMHEILRAQFPIDDILVCPHAEQDGCSCRKPKIGLFIEAIHKWHLDLDRSYIVSDKWQDAAAARLVGCTSLMIRSPWIGDGHYDYLVADLADAVGRLEKLRSQVLLLMDQV
jgi:D-glycero-D-manno-heptose 1,7-bisphosphate phosphatase